MEGTNSNTEIEEQQTRYTLDQALSSIGFGKFQLFVLAYAGLGWIGEAMEIMLLSFIGFAIQPEWGISPRQQNLISTMVSIGMLFGAYSWGVVSDSYGRKKGILSASIITIIAGISSAFAPNYILLLILRCFVGFGLGCGHVFLSWLLEFVPTPNRGTWMVVFTVFWTVGSIMEALLAWWIMPRYSWRLLLVLSAVPSLLAVLFYPLLPESPRYLHTKGRSTEAHDILTKGAKLNNKELPEGQLIITHHPLSIEGNLPETTFNKKELPESQLITNNPGEGNLPESTLLEKGAKLNKKVLSLVKNNPIVISSKDVLSPSYKRTTLLLWSLYFANMFSYYGMVLLTSQLSTEKSACSLRMMPPKYILDGSLYTNVLITSFAEALGLVLAALIVDKVGRKISMEIMIVAGILLLFPLVLHWNAIITTSFLFGARMFISANFIVAHIYAPEVYPTNFRVTGVGMAMAMGRIGGILASLVPVLTACQQRDQVLVLEVTIFLLGLSVFFLPFETRGRVLEDNTESTLQQPLLQ